MPRLSWWRRNKPALAIFIVIFGGLLYFATRDFYPRHRVQAEYLLPRVEVTAQTPYALEWPARAGAPPLSLTIPHTAFPNWISGGKIEVERLSTGHDRLYLFTTLPDPEGLSARALEPWCESGLEDATCSLGEIRILLMQDAPEADDTGYIVMDSQARGSAPATSSGPYRRLNAFWVKEDRERGSMDFVGWDCEGHAPTGVASTNAAKPIVERNRCFEPPTAEDRRAPTQAGYQRFVQLTACSGAGLECKLYFPFRGRFVEAALMESPLTAKTEEDTGHVFLASWEFVNRLYRDHHRAPSVEARLARAGTALENCGAIEARVALVPSEDRQKRFDLRDLKRRHCGYAAELAASALTQRPAEAAALVKAALDGSTFGMGARRDRLMQAAVDALGTTQAPPR